MLVILKEVFFLLTRPSTFKELGDLLKILKYFFMVKTNLKVHLVTKAIAFDVSINIY